MPLQGVCVLGSDGLLTLALIVDAAAGLGVELGADLVEQLVEALARGTRRRANARRIVVHGSHGDGWLRGWRCSAGARGGRSTGGLCWAGGYRGA